MATEHFIAGKDAALETSIERMQGKLAQLGFHVEERSWLNPLDDVWSVHIADRDCPLMFTNGKGASQLAARASALGEFFERLSCQYFWSHYHLGTHYATQPFAHAPQERWFPLDDDSWPEALLTPALRTFYNPNHSIAAEMLVDHNTGNAERGICALPFVRLSDGACIWFPVNIVGNLYVSNGMAAGNTPSEARAQALSEIVERYVKFRVFSEGLCLPEVPEKVIARFPKIAADIAALRAAGYGILVRDASLGGHYPVMSVTLLNPRDHGCYCSFGAHPRFEIALERALTELLQGRALDALDGFPAPGFDAEEIASTPNIEIHFVDSSGIVGWSFLSDEPDFEFHDWNFSTTTAEDYAWLVEMIGAQGFDLYVADYQHLGIYACRIIVPGMSEIYPIDDLEYENNSIANDFREAILYLPELDDEECSDLLDTLNELNLADDRLVAALIGLAPDPDSFWEDLRVGELKTLLALAISNEEAIREGCDWIDHFAQINPSRLRVYRCINTLLQLDEADAEQGYAPFRRALLSLYDPTTLAQAEAQLTGEQRFFGIAAPGVTFEGCTLHRRLLSAYEKVHRAHATFMETP